METLEERGHAAARIEALAFAALHAAAPPAFAAQFGVGVAWYGSVLAQVASAIPITLYNRVLGLGLAEPATAALLDELLALYRPEQIRFGIAITPHAQPPELAAWLLARGFTPRFTVAKWVRGGEAAPPVATDLRVEEIGPEQAAAFARVATEVYGEAPEYRPWLTAVVGQPGWRHFLALDGATPVATAAMFVQDGLAWLGYGATLESHRRRGAQGALLAWRIAAAAAAEVRQLTSETGVDSAASPNHSYRNMARAGFTLLYERTHYIYDPAAQPK